MKMKWPAIGSAACCGGCCANGLPCECAGGSGVEDEHGRAIVVDLGP